MTRVVRQTTNVANPYHYAEFVERRVRRGLRTVGRNVRKITFIGDTNLRLVKGIDRFSEDLDFDCKLLSKDEFMEMIQSL